MRVFVIVLLTVGCVCYVVTVWRNISTEIYNDSPSGRTVRRIEILAGGLLSYESLGGQIPPSAARGEGVSSLVRMLQKFIAANGGSGPTAVLRAINLSSPQDGAITIVDFWGRELLFASEARGEGRVVFRIRSLGPDGIDSQGGGDDIELQFDPALTP
jgi:hypothetical protein